MTVFIILGLLFLALFVVVPLVEKHGKRHSPEELQKITRWIWPLVGIMLVLQLIRMAFF
ncbi:hypothetical protein [Planctobacterium marinum]|uniref:hypothetical protein n=1 Tax=Planctobacterium marinum TaxID=1631968 RepID=UPI001E2ECE1A|nr:hypothetical protein [Planctobacterium marinum]MCC2604459.1 hypothetical protein [Planctobacterium marinum]